MVNVLHICKSPSELDRQNELRGKLISLTFLSCDLYLKMLRLYTCDVPIYAVVIR